MEADPGLQEEAGVIHHVLTQMSRYQEDRQQNMGQKWKLPPNGQPIGLFSGNVTATRTIIRPDDDSEYFYIGLFRWLLVRRLAELILPTSRSQSSSGYIVPIIPFVHYVSPSTQLLK